MRVLTLLLMATMLTGARAAEPASETARVGVTAAHLRSGPGITSPVLATLKRGTVVTVLSEQGEWLQVQVPDSGLTGFVFKALIETAPGEGAAGTPPAPTGAPSAVPAPVATPAAEPGSINGTIAMTAKGGGPAEDLSGTVVYLDAAPGTPPATTVNIDMKGKEFVPHVVVVGVGSRVEFPNFDPILHNVFSPSTPNNFDLGLYMRPDKGGFVFHHAGVAHVYCNIHPQMSAVVVVRDNPYFAKASRKGAFTFTGIPAGRYTLHAWHEEAVKEATTSVAVPAGGTVSTSLALDASSFERQSHKRKDGKDYAPDAGRQ